MLNVRWIALGAIALIAIGAAACSDDDDDATPTPSVCDEKEALEQSVESLTSLDVVASGTDGLTAAVDQVRTDAQALKETASDTIAPDVDALTAAIDDAQETISGIDSDATLNERIDAVQTALTGIATATSDLKDSLQNECP